MADTSRLSRIIIKEHTADNNYAGTYKLLMAAKSIPSPSSAPNTVESTTLEDDTQTFEKGVKQSDAKEVTGNLEKQYITNLKALKDKKVDIMHLYGTDGIGGTSKWVYTGEVDYNISEVGGVDEIVEMVATIIPNTVPLEVVDEYTVTESNGTFTVAKKNA